MKPNLLLICGATQRMMDRLAADFTVHNLSEITDLTAFLAETGPSVQYVATDGHLGVKPQIMDGLPNLKVISSYGVGYDAIDTTTAAQRGIVVTHTPNVLNDEVADTTLMLLLAVSRDLMGGEAHARSGAWERDGNAPLTRSIKGRTVGILGLGRIGQAIADRLEVFGCEVVYHSRSAKDVAYRYYDNLTDMAADASVVVCITPGGPATQGIINAEVLRALGPDGILINVSRGSVVDEPALIAALEAGEIAGAGLDVFAAEPHIPDALKAMSNVVLQPHVGSATIETRQAMGDLTCANLSQHLKDGTTVTPVPECAHL